MFIVPTLFNYAMNEVVERYQHDLDGARKQLITDTNGSTASYVLFQNASQRVQLEAEAIRMMNQSLKQLGSTIFAQKCRRQTKLSGAQLKTSLLT